MFQIELSKCRYPLHGLDVRHMYPTPTMTVATGPILVKELDNGEYLVEDGRHRVIRALLRGEELIDAEWFDDHQADLEAQRVSAVIKSQLSTPAAAGDFPNGTYGRIQTGFTIPHPQTIIEASIPHRPESSVPRYSWSSPKAACGKYHVHDPHPLYPSIGMADMCDGKPKP